MPADPKDHVGKLEISAAHPTAEGHFPGNPIVPGAVLLAEIAHMIAPGATSGAVRVAKFSKAVRPGDCLDVSWRQKADGAIAFEGRLADGSVAVSGTLAANGGAS